MSKESSDTPPQAEHWVPQDARLREIVPILNDATHQAQAEGFFAVDAVGSMPIEKAYATAFVAAAPHVDGDFSRWFILLVVKAPQGVELHNSLHRKLPRKEALVSALSIPFHEGELVVFDAHKLHWVDRPQRLDCAKEGMTRHEMSEYLQTHHFDNMSVVMSTETHRRPTREQAESLMADYLGEFTPQAWARTAPQMGIPPHPKPRRP